MGWARGSEIMNGIIDALQKHIANERKRELIYEDIFEVLNDHDWDTQDECRGRDPVFDRVLDRNGYGLDEE